MPNPKITPIVKFDEGDLMPTITGYYAEARLGGHWFQNRGETAVQARFNLLQWLLSGNHARCMRGESAIPV